MLDLALTYKFSNAPAPSQLENALMELLTALSETGSIAGAATHLNRSYRHVWGQLKYWESTLNARLVVWGRRSGGAGLTPEAVEFLRAMQKSEKALASNVKAIKRELLKNTSLLHK